MLIIDKYILLGLSTVFLIGLFSYFSDDGNTDFDHYGIVHDVKSSSAGFTFYIETVDDVIRCFSREEPDHLGYYGIRGNMSEDGSMFFVEKMMNIDNKRNQH